MSKAEKPPETGRMELHSWRDFAEVMKIMRAGKWIYRGQEDASWSLESGLDRYLKKFEKAGKREKGGYRNQLFTMSFPRAEYFAISRFMAMSQEHQKWDTYADALIAMQHYGAKTRLLDFTTSIMVALFFAYETQANGIDRAIYAINYRALLDQNGMWSCYKKFLQDNVKWVDSGDEQARWEFESQIENHYFRQFAFTEANKIIEENTQEGVIRILPLYTVYSNKRQLAQTGVELMPRTFDWFDNNLAAALNVSVEEINEPTHLVPNDFGHLPSALVKLVFDARMEKDALHILDQANINAATIYPDLIGVAKSTRYDNCMLLIDDAIGQAKESLTAERFWIPKSKIFTCSLSDAISSVIDEMVKRGYSHIPVMDEKGKVIGVFSESTMMDGWRAKICSADALTMKDIANLLPIENHKVDVFRFVSKCSTAASLKKMCEESIQNGDRIGLFFVTEHGKSDEPLLGILTVWDIAGVSDLSTTISV